jgi:hypothetical protein
MAISFSAWEFWRINTLDGGAVGLTEGDIFRGCVG